MDLSRSAGWFSRNESVAAVLAWTVSPSLLVSRVQAAESSSSADDTGPVGLRGREVPAQEHRIPKEVFNQQGAAILGYLPGTTFLAVGGHVSGSNSRRSMMFEMDVAIQRLGREQATHPSVISLTGVYHDLLRQWAEM